MVDIAAFFVMVAGLMLFLRNPLNVGYIVGALTSVFVYLPLLIHTFVSADFIYYSMTQLTFSSGEARETAKLYLVVLGALWLAGATLGDHFRLTRPKSVKEEVRKLLWHRALIALIGVMLIYVAAVASSGVSLIEMVTPSRKQGMEFLESEYVRGIVIATPTVLGCLLLAFEKRLTALSLTSVGVAVIIALGTAQRRSVVIVIVAYLITYLMSRLAAQGVRNQQDLEASMKRLTMIALALLSTLSPVLWYARNYFTGLQRTGQASLTGTMELRGFSELFFGSAATAYPATAMVVQMLQDTYNSIGYSFLFMISSPIPRGMWPGKPEAPGSILIEYYNLEYSPSIFLLTELVMNFAFAAPIVAFALAFLVTRLGKRFRDGSDMMRVRSVKSPILSQVLFAILVAQAMLMFKNGFTLFTMQMMIWGGIATAIYYFISERSRHAR